MAGLPGRAFHPEAPGLRVIAYGVNAESRLMDLNARVNLICSISMDKYIKNAATAPGDLFAQSFDPR